MTWLIVFSHLRWSFVYQRTQHLISRLARHYPVLYIEEPVPGRGPARFDVVPQGPNLDVLVPHTPVGAPGFHDDPMARLGPMLASHLGSHGIDDWVAWFNTPMALPLLAGLAPRAIVCDCIDEPAAFDRAPHRLREREAALLDIADLVLTAGPARFESKRRCNANTHCVPSSVDAAHFSPSCLDPANAEALAAERLHADARRPRLGCFGVIDARIDLALLATLADRHPEWQVLMVGPIVNTDPATLPQRPNLHWLGPQPHARLPYLLAGWDLCLMPFLIDATTRAVNPTQALEYMAGAKPVVSTPVPDVIALYGDTVRIGSAADGSFVVACEQALAEARPQRDRRVGAMLDTVQRASWDRAADTVHGLIEAVLAARPAVAGRRQPIGR